MPKEVPTEDSAAPADQSSRTRTEGRSGERLESWKAIATYLDKDVSTVQRWEKLAGLPVHRNAESRVLHVYTLRSELDAWRNASGPARQAPIPTLVVLPFQVLRSDDDVAFLGFSLPDAITKSLSGLRSLVVRSRLTVAQTSDPTDLRVLAEQTDVDMALTGTLLRDGQRVRLTAQLIDVPSGTVRWSRTTESALDDLFRLEDELTRHLVESLSLELTHRERERLRRDMPSSAKAYEFYLRANQLSLDIRQWSIARDLYVQSVEEDPDYAPAWARLGRLHRVIAKMIDTKSAARFGDGMARAEAAFARAFSLGPELAVAHNYYTPLQVERGGAGSALVRLLERTRSSATDPELFAGLVVACRYCGLLPAARAAHVQARLLDPGVPTSVHYVDWAEGRYEDALVHSQADPVYNAPMRAFCLVELGRNAEAAALLDGTFEQLRVSPILHDLAGVVRGLATEEKGGELLDRARSYARFVSECEFNPEGRVGIAVVVARAGDLEGTMRLLQLAIVGGYACPDWLRREPSFDPLRARTDFGVLLTTAERRRAEAATAFRLAGGDDVLDVTCL